MKPSEYHTGDADTRPWGSWQVKDVFDGSVLKRIDVLPGKRLSLQRHSHRCEHWVVASGEAEVTIDSETRTLRRGESVDIPATAVHRLANNGTETLIVLELQHGSLLSEDDIERIEDDFGRT